MEIPETDIYASENLNLLVCMNIAQQRKTWPKMNEVSQLPLDDEFLSKSPSLNSHTASSPWGGKTNQERLTWDGAGCVWLTSNADA